MITLLATLFGVGIGLLVLLPFWINLKRKGLL